MAIEAVMKAAWIESFGDAGVIRTGIRTVPVRGPGEVLVKMVAATVNHRDVYLRRGEAGRIKLPVVLGSDGAGIVVEADAASSCRPGDRVAIYPVVACGVCRSCRAGLPHKCRVFGMVGGERDGTHAEFAVVPEQCVVRLPDALDFDTAAAISLAGLTAWNMVVDEGVAQQGEHALVLGASGGVGVFTVMLLKRLGLIVHAVTSSPAKRQALLDLGADSVLDDNPGAVLRHTRKLPNGGVDLAFNSVGGTTWRYVLPAVSAGGRILLCGTVRSPAAELDMRQVFYRNLVLKGCSMGTPGALARLLDVAASDARFRSPVDSIIAIDGIPDAHRRMEVGQLLGKVLIKM
jgi:NADPH:quinone reductase-like Zn-dependent oxidoreductase